MNTLSSEELVGEIVRANGRLALFLGAGASRSSGIPTAGELVEQWRKELHQRDQGRGHTQSYADWLIADEQNYEQWLKERSGDRNLNDRRYAYLFEKLEYTSAGRQRVIADLCEKARPQAGYYSLAHLIDATTINVAVTTNFDDLIADACFELGTTRPQVSSHSETALLVRLTDPRPKIVKLHGDFLFEDLQNTEEETQHLRAGMEVKFQSVLQEFGLVVVGYGGNDESIMQNLSRARGRGLFWCVRKGSSLSKNVQEVLEKTHDAFLVDIDGFDEFMVELFRACGGDRSILRERREQRQEHVNHMLEQLKGAEPPTRAVAAARKQLGYSDLISEGNRLKDQGDLEGAGAAYREAIELDPKSAAAYNNLGLALRAKGDLAEAEAAYRKAIELDPQGATAHNNLGGVLRAKGDLSGAEAARGKAIELDPKNAIAHSNLGVVLRNKGDLAGAEAACRKAIELDPKNANFHSNLGSVLRDRGELPEAEAAGRKSIELDPKNAIAHSILGAVLRNKGDLPGAEAACRKAIELDTGNSAAYNNLGFILLATGNSNTAIAHFRIANGLAIAHPHEVDHILEVGLSYAGLGDVDNAMDSFRSWAQRTKMKLRSDIVIDLRFMASHGHKPAEDVLQALKKEGLLPPE